MNTDWNSPQGDFDTAEKQGELLMLLSRQQVTVHTWDDPDFDYMEEQDLALVVQSPSGTEDLLIELCGEFSVFFEKWHGEYAATAEGYAQLQQDITAILDGKAGALSLYTENGWQGTVLCTELPGAEDAAAALKRCWQGGKAGHRPACGQSAGAGVLGPGTEPESTAPGRIIEQKGRCTHLCSDLFLYDLLFLETIRHIVCKCGGRSAQCDAQHCAAEDIGGEVHIEVQPGKGDKGCQHQRGRAQLPVL